MVVFLVTFALLSLTALAWWRKLQSKNLSKFLERDAPRDTIILHQFGPGPYVPSISPFVMKLETFLRVTKIPYQNRFDRRLGPKGKIPWLQYNNEIVSDSQHCVEFMNKTFRVNLNRRLTSQQLALGHVIRRTLEEWMYWMLIMWRLVFEPNGTLYRSLGLPRLLIWYMRRVSNSRVFSQGIGLHSKEEVLTMMKSDLNALNELLGDNNFLFGDKISDLTEFDCALFGQLCQLVWQTPGCGVHEMIEEEYPNLVAFCQRMKEAFWPDWNERLQKPSNQQSESKEPISSTATTATSTTTVPPSIGVDQSLRKECNNGDPILASNLSFNNRINNNVNVNNGIIR